MIGLGSLSLPPDVEIFVIGAVAILTRLSMMFAFLPGIGELAIPIRVRLGLVLAVSAALIPSVLPGQLAILTTNDPLVLIGFEAMIGFALGFGFRVLIFALTIAGTIISQSISLSQIFGAVTTTEPSPTISTLLMMTGAALFVTLDLHTYSVGLLMESYQLFPLGELPDTGALAGWAQERVSGSFALAISLSLPFILVSFLYNVVLGLINQAMPQMMVTFVGVPANVLAGLVILGIAFAAIMMAWVAQVDTGFAGFW
ncbi:flagellar biosynthetic protein FliR [Parvularcula sp. LCG005]|uniref:flagellar biosynthetic protein FliR n=1 Tax=Parvularcula sp. LCG005 TaxID=3078805 RepID=UPI002942C8CD|nr:flagellar biosynthetic protein FliR [Parvularcula sp. LCG005]WOI52674.1 flagellar biosynthetic protein FliR [Parvularcula sp. LCG005]